MKNIALKPTILLVDDSKENRKQIEDSLCNDYNIMVFKMLIASSPLQASIILWKPVVVKRQ